MNRLKSIIERQESTPGKLLDWFIQALIVASLVSFSLETLPGLESGTLTLLKHTEVICVVIYHLSILPALP